MKQKAMFLLAGAIPLSCVPADRGEDVGKSSENIVLNEACGPDSNSGPEADPCRITRTQLDERTIVTRIDEPVVDRQSYDYNTVTLGPGDSFSIDASGCVQTGGSGSTWKRYVNPSGSDSDHLYFGLISVPGVLTQRRVSEMIGQTITLDENAPATHIVLGYTDDDYPDNGYWSHDDGTEDQCSFSNGNDGGPAHLTITIRSPEPIPDPVRPRPQGSVPQPGKAWDLVSNLVDGQRAQLDDNLQMFQPRWQWQEPGASNATHQPAFDTSLVSQALTSNGPPWWKAPINGCGNGHLNWNEATYQGNLFWDEHDSLDDDYNVKITSPAITNATSADDLNAGVTADDGATTGNGAVKMIKGEFDSDETVDADEFDLIPWWRNFHNSVDDSDASARGMMDGRPAIMMGMMGLDRVHGSPSELHPVHVLAVREGLQSNPSDDAWAIFVRNWGNEGACGDQQIYMSGNDYTVRLPRPDGVSQRAQAQLLAATQFAGHNTGQANPTVFTAQNQDTLVTFHLPAGNQQGFIVGELHLTWTALPLPFAPAPVAAAPMSPVLAAADPGEEDDFDQILSTVIESLTPAERQIYDARVAALTPPRPTGTTTVLQAVLVTEPPPLPSAPPSISMAPATRALSRLQAKLTALCELKGGSLPISGVCQPVAPTSSATATLAVSAVTGCFATPDLVRLSVKDASGTGIARIEYSLDGTTFTPYSTPLLLPQGTTLYYRAVDNAQNVEATKTFVAPGDANGAAFRGAAAFTSHGFSIDDGGVVSSLVAGGAANLVNAGTGQASIGAGASVSNITSKGSVFLRDRARVNGSIVTAQPSITRQNNTVVTGTITTNASLNLPNLSACQASFPAAGSTVFLDVGTKRSLGAGSYAAVTVQPRAILTLTAGTYFFTSLDIEPSAKVVLDTSGGAIFILVKNSLIVRGPFVDTANRTASAFLAYFGSQSTSIEVPYQGSLLAPSASVTLAVSGGTYSGSFFAKDLELTPRSFLKH